jgi:hypothetical protein
MTADPAPDPVDEAERIVDDALAEHDRYGHRLEEALHRATVEAVREVEA